VVPDAGTSVPFDDVTLSFFRGWDAGVYAFHTQSALNAAWAQAPFQVYPIGIVLTDPGWPTIDFGTSAVVGVSLGFGSWCHGPEIRDVLASGQDVTVQYQRKQPSTSACLADGPLISFATVPAFSGSATFVEHQSP
jgi:hypothetical protein